MGIGVCRVCAGSFERHGRAPFRYCEAHRVDRAEQNRRKAKAHTARKRVARSPVACVVCGTDFMAFRSDAKTCSLQCKIHERNRRARESEQRHRGVCVECGKQTARRSKRCRQCSQPFRATKISGERNYAWKGGRTRDGHGYIQILVAPEARKGHRYRPEHQLVWEAANGPIPGGYIIHHRNGIKDDNRLENLEAMPRRKHNHRYEEHDRRIVELEAEVARLRELLDGSPDTTL